MVKFGPREIVLEIFILIKISKTNLPTRKIEILKFGQPAVALLLMFIVRNREDSFQQTRIITGILGFLKF